VHDTSLLFTIAVSLAFAFFGGFLALRVGLSPIVGYLVVGVAIGPYTPGLVADTSVASQLAEIGVILLMFGVGLHFSVADLLHVRRIAVPGAVLQITAATVMTVALAKLWGWSWGSGLVLGLALSVASTVVLLRTLEDRGELASEDGNIAVGWLIVEDLAMVLALVLLPALSTVLGGQSDAGHESQSLVTTLLWTLGKVAVFVALMLMVGIRVFPWLLDQVAKSGSRELFTLFVVGAALGIAYGASALFGMSFALGAFFAGIVIHESHLSDEAAAKALPLQDAFAVLFFVSVGMLFDPAVVVQKPWHVLGVVAIIVIGKSLAALGLILGLGYGAKTALLVSASLAQIGEFSFILADLGRHLKLLPSEGHSLILAGALISITLNPLAFHVSERLLPWLTPRFRGREEATVPPPESSNEYRDHVVLVGFGRVGKVIAASLSARNIPFVVLEQNRNTVELLRQRGVTAYYGDAESEAVLKLADLPHARVLVVTPLDSFQARQIVESASRVNPQATLIVRSHNEEQRKYLESMGSNVRVMGDPELGGVIAEQVVQGWS
jgi:monovalent cation:H+ antiporter-2, CPA2 family